MVALELYQADVKSQHFLINDNNDYYNFLSKPMDHWDSKDVCNFLSYALNLKNVEDFKNISRINGFTFKALSIDMFQKMVDNKILADQIYEAKENFLKNYTYSLNENNNNLFNTYNFEGAEYCSIYNNNIDYNSYNDYSIMSNFSNKMLNNFENDDKFCVKPRKAGRPRTKPLVLKSCALRKEKLWEFLIHLLHDEKSCPSLICWEDYKQGTFRFVQNEKVAQIWGDRKKNKNMNYDKFSRAMRYYYKSKVLLPVRGQRLVYKFGPQAKGWKIEQ